MLIIAHRGLLNGPDEKLQNTEHQVQTALDAGFDAEIDVWYINGKYFLGHDTPDYEISWKFLTQSNLWIHCKNLPAFFDMRNRTIIHNYFWHETDSVILTNRGNIWTYFGKPEMASSESICVMPEITYSWNEIEKLVNSNTWMGFCTDYPLRIQKCLK